MMGKTNFASLLLSALLLCGIWCAALADDKAARETCIKTAKLNEADAKRITDATSISKDLTDASDAIKCFLPCYYKEIGVVGADGKTNLGKVVEYMEQVTGVTDKMRVTAAMAECGSTQGANACDKVYQFERCVLQRVSK